MHRSMNKTVLFNQLTILIAYSYMKYVSELLQQ